MNEDERPPWYAPDHAARQQGAPCTPRPRERLWTVVKGGKRVDAELLFHNEYGVEVQLAHEDVMAYAQRFAVKADAVAEPDHHRARLEREGWTDAMIMPPSDPGES